MAELTVVYEIFVWQQPGSEPARWRQYPEGQYRKAVDASRQHFQEELPHQMEIQRNIYDGARLVSSEQCWSKPDAEENINEKLMTDDELIEFLRANIAQLDHKVEGLSRILPDRELPLHWRIIEGLNLEERTDLRQIATRGQFWRSLGAPDHPWQLRRRALIVEFKRSDSYIFYTITDAGRDLVTRLPDAATDNPHSPDNEARVRRLWSALLKARGF